MKKIRNIIIIAMIITAVAIAGFLAVKYKGGDNSEDVLATQKTYATPEEMYLDNLIDSISPSGEIYVSPKEKILISVVAYSKAQVSVRVGTKRYDAKPADTETEGYTAFTVKVTMPKTREEIDSIGTISVTAICSESSMQLSGAAVYSAEEMNDITVTQPTTVLSAGNYVPDLPGDAYEYTTLPIYNNQTAPTTTPHIQSDFTGNQMCIVTKSFADTWPLIAGDDTYVPYYTPLINGTVDYVTAASEAYNEDDGEMVYFYELSSGRKVKRDSVQLIPQQTLSKNSISIVSSAGYGGALTIKFKTDWKVPYAFTYGPQNYYSAYGKKYNVTSFTANYLQMTFYHTNSASGNVDASGSDVISSAYWNVSGDTATLTMPLRFAGQYYGYSIEYDQNGYLSVTIHNKPQSLRGSVILLDPGHGGNDPGALGLGGGVYESNVNYALAYYTKLYLEAKGATVYMTRGGDTAVGLEERKAMVRSLKPDLFVSIHCNGNTDKTKIGTAVYYYKPFSYKLANNIYNQLLSVFRNNLYYGQSTIYDSLADGTAYYPFSVARLEDCPSVLIETGYITNDSECMKLIDANNQQKLANAIAVGIEQSLI
jgi:N-acetylmuramoyl-L-alanine amidase